MFYLFFQKNTIHTQVSKSKHFTSPRSELVHAHPGNLHSAFTHSIILVILQLLILVNCRNEFAGIFDKVLFSHMISLRKCTSKVCMCERG